MFYELIWSIRKIYKLTYLVPSVRLPNLLAWQGLVESNLNNGRKNISSSLSESSCRGSVRRAYGRRKRSEYRA